MKYNDNLTDHAKRVTWCAFWHRKHWEVKERVSVRVWEDSAPSMGSRICCHACHREWVEFRYRDGGTKLWA